MNLFKNDLLVHKPKNNENRWFWVFQLSGWCTYSLLTFFSFTYLENDIDSYHYIHLLMQGFLGVLCSWPLRPLLRWSFKLTIFAQIALAVLVSSVFALLWTCLRMLFFIWVSGLPDMWLEFNSWLYGALFVFWGWSALYFGAKYYSLHKREHQQLIEAISLKREAQMKRLQAESSARESQLQMLRYQLNPHFLFNTLNAVTALIRLGENKKAEQMIQQLSQFLRYSLDNDSTENVALEDEIEILMLYLNVEKARFEERLSLAFEIEPSAYKALVPSFILQPIFENSLKYAVATNESGGAIHMTAQVSNNELLLNITDTGSDICLKAPDKNRGIGLSNIQKRLEVSYGADYAFHAAPDGDMGFSVVIRIPYQTKIDKNNG